MKIFLSNQIREADEYTIKNEPISPIDLMERAAGKCVEWITNKYKNDTKIKVFAGPGNNGGDGLAIARILAEKKYKIDVYIVKFTDNYSDDFKINYEQLTIQNKVKIHEVVNSKKMPEIKETDVIIDALFGSGLTRVISGLSADVVHLINQSNAVILSIDIPSGLFGEDNYPENKTIVKADYTLTFEFPFLSFFFAQNEEYVGKVTILPIGIHPDYIDQTPTPFQFLDKEIVATKIKKRRKFSHKGNFGHAFLIAGSYGKLGAAIMAARACHRTGIGLLTAHVPKCGTHIMQTTSPETMLSIDQQEEFSSEYFNIDKYNAIGIGPGIGLSRPTRLMLKVLVDEVKNPVVYDADAITILGDNKDWLNDISSESIFTPHPKEFERLVGKIPNAYQRLQKTMEFSQKYNVYVVLKGAYTTIACPDGECFINSTGNPGMATAGSGDVLTGMILSFLAQGYSSKDACITAVYLHGLAGDIAAKKYGQHALIASDIIDNISEAFLSIKNT